MSASSSPTASPHAGDETAPTSHGASIPFPKRAPSPRVDQQSDGPHARAADPGRVLVLPRQQTPGWPSEKAIPAADALTLDEAFTASFKTDAHFVAYLTEPPRRLKREAVGEVPISMTLFAADVDCPEAHREGSEAPPSWREAEQAKLGPLLAHGAVVYDTRGGYRLILRLSTPFTIATEADEAAWRALYMRGLLWLGTLGICADPACRDWTRLYRLPRATRAEGSAPEAREFLGNVNNLGSWTPPSLATADQLTHADQLAASSPEAWQPALRHLPEWAARSSAALRFPAELDTSPAYGAKALAEELAKVRTAQSGSRNVQLNTSALKLGRLIAAGQLSAEPTWQALAAAAIEAGLPPAEVEQTLRSGLSAGLKAPRTPKPRRTAREAKAPARGAPTPSTPRKAASQGGGSSVVVPFPNRAAARGAGAPGRGAAESAESPQTARSSENGAAAKSPAMQSVPDIAQPEGAAFKLTETGLAERLHAKHGEGLRFVPSWKRWLCWDGRRWAFDETKELDRMGKDTVRGLYEEAGRAEQVSARKEIAAFAARSESAKVRRAMITLAESEGEIACKAEVFDQDKWLFNVENGTMNLRTGELLPHRKEDFLRKLAPVGCAADARCPTWEAFLERVLPDAETRAFVQRAVGYSLTGQTTEHVLFVLWGSGRNGKSTFVEALHAVLGDYAQTADFGTFLLQKDHTRPRNDLAGLAGARLVSAVESEEGARLAESFVKQITGGDKVAARFLFSEFFEFHPQFKIWLATNHKPQVRATDEGLWRRIRLIPFTVTIPEVEVDPELPQKLVGERSGILAWALEGCRRWQREGLRAPPQVRAATEEYRRESDVVGTFLEERCLVDRTARVSAGPLLKAFESWASANGEATLNATAFGRRLKERGFLQRKSHGRMEWVGLGLLAEEGKSGHWGE